MDRPGYLKWRNTLKKFHADLIGKIMQENNYSQKDIEFVQHLILKKNLFHDAQVQLLEDVICLVFLQYYFDDFSKTKKPEMIMDIVKKTLRKMSEKAKSFAMNMKLSSHAVETIQKALAESAA